VEINQKTAFFEIYLVHKSTDRGLILLCLKAKTPDFTGYHPSQAINPRVNISE
jgi:hypothetical protein